MNNNLNYIQRIIILCRIDELKKKESEYQTKLISQKNKISDLETLIKKRNNDIESYIEQIDNLESEKDGLYKEISNFKTMLQEENNNNSVYY